MAKSKKSKKSKKSPLAIIFVLLSLVFAFVSIAFISMDGVGYQVKLINSTADPVFPYLVKDVLFGIKSDSGKVILEPNVGLLIGFIIILLGSLISIATIFCKYAGFVGGLISLVGGILMFCATVLFGDFQGLDLGALGNVTKLLGPGFILIGATGILSAISSFVAGVLKK